MAVGALNRVKAISGALAMLRPMLRLVIFECCHLFDPQGSVQVIASRHDRIAAWRCSSA
jgi:hypothetical protein